MRKKTQPKYQALIARLSREIRSGLYEPGARLPGQNALARAHGVSVITANRALNELRALGLVERRERSGTFVAGSPGALSEIIAVAGTRLDDMGLRTMDFWRGISARAEERGMPSQIVNHSDPILEKRVRRAEARVGVVLVDHEEPATVDMLERSSVPHVLVGLEARRAAHCVLENRRRAASALTSRMLRDGCERMAFVGNTAAQTHRLARDGFLEAVEGRRMRPIVEAVSNSTVAGVVRRLLARRAAPDGLIIMGGSLPFLALPLILARPERPRLGVMTEGSTIMRLSSIAYVARYSQVEAGEMAFDLLARVAAGEVEHATTQYPPFEVLAPR